MNQHTAWTMSLGLALGVLLTNGPAMGQATPPSGGASYPAPVERTTPGSMSQDSTGTGTGTTDMTSDTRTGSSSDTYRSNTADTMAPATRLPDSSTTASANTRRPARIDRN